MTMEFFPTRMLSKTFKQKTFFQVNLSFLVWTLTLLILFSSVSGSGRSEVSCHKLKAVLESRKYLDNKIPLEPVSDNHLKKCAKDSKGTCCLEETEVFFLGESRKEYNRAVWAAINQLSLVLKTRAKRFDSFFKNLLSESKRDFDKMFKKTYGIIYEQNAYVFTDFFEELERYYVKGQVDLEEAMENFFNTLYQKMFTVLNAQYQFDEKYLLCIGDHMKELKPFGDVPQKLSVQIKRSFVATRTFAQALNIAKDILDYMKDVGAAGDCYQALLRMSYCQACKGTPEIKPCNNLCLNVLKGCLAYQMDLDTEWNNFVDAMDKVSDRLLGPFNIEVVVEPINIKISEAIMNFQENAHEVSEKVFNGCGRLHIGRRNRRETREIELETYEFAKEDVKYQKPQQQPTLEKLIRDIRQKVKDSKSFWANLPYQICNDEKVAVTSKETPCWNGTAVGRYTRKVISNGFSNQQNNPEVNIDTSRPKSILNEQLYNLKIVTNKLKNAYNGFDVDWIDMEGESSPVEDSSGEGSGSGKIETEGSGTGPEPDSNFDGSEVGSDDEDDVERKIRPNPKRPVSSNDESNVIPKNADDLLIRGGTNVYSGGTSTLRSRMSLLKAVISYVFPICIMWLGGSIYEWLQIFHSHPRLSNSVIYGSLYVAAEFSQQLITKQLITDEREKLIDYKSLGRYLVVGSLINSNYFYSWYKWLDTKYVGTSSRIIMKKVLLDQFIMTPPLYVIFFVTMSFLEGKKDLLEECRAKFLKTFSVSCLFWLPAQTINFLYLPHSARIAYMGLCSFVWMNILCWIKAKDSKHSLHIER